MNNSLSNIAFLCVKHHKDAHRSGDGRIGGGPRPRVVEYVIARARGHWENAKVMRASGMTYAMIGKEMGFAKDTVRHWFDRYGR
jgi:hypothetical protein